MRVTDSGRYDMFTANLNALKERIDNVQEMISSGKKVLHPSDDAVVISQSITIGADKDTNTQMKRNLDKLKMLGSTYETSITTMQDLLTRAKEIAVTMASDNMDASNRASASEEVKGIIEQLVTIGNTKVGNTYIFGGLKSDTAPFSLNSADYSVTWNGSSDVAEIFVDKGEKEKMGISGSTVFFSGGTSVFDVLKNFKVALDTNDTTGIKGAMDGLDQMLNLTETNTAYIGTYTGKIDSLIQSNSAKDLNLTTILSDMTDADVASLITEFNTLTNAYQSTVYALSKIQNLNILSYL